MKNPAKHTFCAITEIDITPIDFAAYKLVGFNRPDNTPRGILHPLIAQALILKSESQTGCLLTIDSIGFTTSLTTLLRDEAAKILNTTRESIMVCFSHTHAAPDGAADNSAYFQFALSRILEMLSPDNLNFFPAAIAWDIAENTIGINRRKGNNTMDKRLGLLKVADITTNEAKAIILRITAHANVLTSDNYLISADFFGVTRNKLAEKYNCKILMTQGASGDIRSRYRQHNADLLEEKPEEAAAAELTDDEAMKKSIFAESLEALEKNADEICQAIAKVYPQLQAKPIRHFALISDSLSYHSEVPDLHQALAIAEEAKKEAGIDGEQWLTEVKHLRKQHIFTQTTTREIQYFIINEGCLCGIADEPMCEIAINIAAKADDNLLFFGGYTNGYEGYLPTSAEYDNGGYEVLWSSLVLFPYYGRVMPLSRDTASKLTDTVVKKWHDMKHCF